MKAVLGSRSLPKIDKKAVAEYRARIREHALVLIDDGMKNQTIYDNLKQAAVGVGDLIAKREEANWGSRGRKTRDRLREKIDQALKTLKPKKRKIVKLRYGMKDGYIHLLKEVAGIFQISKERVRQIESEAIEQLKGDSTADELRKLVDSPAISQFLQRPGFSRRRAKT